jgi:hypothetical protein
MGDVLSSPLRFQLSRETHVGSVLELLLDGNVVLATIDSIPTNGNDAMLPYNILFTWHCMQWATIQVNGQTLTASLRYRIGLFVYDGTITLDRPFLKIPFSSSVFRD